MKLHRQFTAEEKAAHAAMLKERWSTPRTPAPPPTPEELVVINRHLDEAKMLSGVIPAVYLPDRFPTEAERMAARAQNSFYGGGRHMGNWNFNTGEDVPYLSDEF
jgi:hypothetical protein